MVVGAYKNGVLLKMQGSPEMLQVYSPAAPTTIIDMPHRYSFADYLAPRSGQHFEFGSAGAMPL